MKAFLEQELFYIIIELAICLSVVLLFLSVVLDFALFSRDKQVKKEKKSIVETGTMTLFFIIFYFILRSKIGMIIILDDSIRRILIIMGTLAIVAGCIMNIRGRFNLGKNWANHIKIYDEQTLVQEGMYRIVRHPLYSSIMLMFFGGCIVFANVAAFIAVCLIFIPFMYYRAKQEERLLIQTFPEYIKYQSSTGMFFPKLFKGKERF